MPVSFGPLPTPLIPGKQTAYLAVKGLHEASEQVGFFLKHLFLIQLVPLAEAHVEVTSGLQFSVQGNWPLTRQHLLHFLFTCEGPAVAVGCVGACGTQR